MHQKTSLQSFFKVKLVGINGFDIVDGKPRAILGLMWSIILRFQVSGTFKTNFRIRFSKSHCPNRKANLEASSVVTCIVTVIDWVKQYFNFYSMTGPRGNAGNSNRGNGQIIQRREENT